MALSSASPSPRGLSIQKPPTSAKLFQRTFHRLRLPGPAPRFEVEYYPFTGIRHTVRLRRDRVLVRISDILKGAPPIVLEALAEMLVCGLFGRRTSEEARECYQEFVSRPRVQRRAQRARQKRGTKKIASPRGHAYDLQAIYRRLNRRFFATRFSGVKIGWSMRQSRQVLGHFDPAHRAIVITRALDHPETPQFALEYLVYHEMLHLKFPPQQGSGRRSFHSRQFRQEEKKFPRFAEARRTLGLLCSTQRPSHTRVSPSPLP